MVGKLPVLVGHEIQDDGNAKPSEISALKSIQPPMSKLFLHLFESVTLLKTDFLNFLLKLKMLKLFGRLRHFGVVPKETVELSQLFSEKMQNSHHLHLHSQDSIILRLW